MSRRPILIGVVTLVLAAFAVTGIGIGRSTNIVSSPQTKVAKPDIPGTIDGKVNPELIPDHIAYTMVFRTIALRQGTDFEKSRSRAWAKSVGLDDAVADKLLAAATEFHARVSVLDNQVKEIKDRSWPNPSAQVMAQLTVLQNQKEAIVAEMVSSLPTQLGIEGAQKLQNYVINDVKRKVKIAPGLAVPPGQHH